MVFDLDSDMIAETIANALESVGAQVSEEQFLNIAGAIDKGMPGVVQLIAQSTLENWRAQASGVSTGWGNKYAAAIKMDNNGEIEIDQEMIDKASGKPSMMYAMLVEKGMKSFSIKEALLASEKAKTGKDGIKYITIPFPVRAPSRKGQGKMSSQFQGREMTREMHKIVKAGGKITSGSIKVKGRDVDVSGLTRYSTRQLHSQYGIFRRVSENSKGWKHPGVPAEPVFPSVLREVNKTIHKTLTAFCKAIVQEYTKS